MLSSSEFAELVAIYGWDKTIKAERWFNENFTPEFRLRVYAVRFIVTNEYLWSNWSENIV